MEKLIKFIEGRYNMAYYWYQGDTAAIGKLLNQAFGALEFYHHQNPEQFDECERLWNEEWHPKFLELLKGY